MPTHAALRLSSYENLVWAWRKLVNYYKYSEVWYDELELSTFELNLDRELASLAQSFTSGRYQTIPLRPLPYPKRNTKGEIEVRQFFWANVRDQVAWLSYLNIVGPELDSQMPAWSYGNRLFRSMIVEQQNAAAVPRFTPGPYRNTRAQVYKPFRQSWPLYRRHVLLALKRLTRPSIRVVWDEHEDQLLAIEQELETNERLVYLRDNFWTRRSSTVYWCSFDITKFYPSIPLEKVTKTLAARSETAREIGIPLLESLSQFDIDSSGWSRTDLKRLELENKTSMSVIPTGLIGSGILANVAMLPVDDWADAQVKERQIAHFRYVDDHIVVAPKFDSITKWFADYRQYLRDELGCEINEKKTEPLKMRRFLRKPDPKRRRLAMQYSSLDPAFPSPLMTKTLEKISDLAHTNFDLLDMEEQNRVLHDVEHLLLAPLPDEELPEKTRVTFSARLLGQFACQIDHENSDLLKALLEQDVITREVNSLEKQLGSLRPSSAAFKECRAVLHGKQIKLRALDYQIVLLRRQKSNRRYKLQHRTRAILLKAYRVITTN